MLTNTTGGVVTYKLRNSYTIRLSTGRELKVTMPGLELQLGERCNVAFNHETGRVSQIYSLHDTMSEEPEEPAEVMAETPDFEDCPTWIDSGSVLGGQEVKEYWEWECSRGTEE